MNIKNKYPLIFLSLGIFLLINLDDFSQFLSLSKSKSFSVTQTTQADFNNGIKENVQVTNISGGEVKLASSFVVPDMGAFAIADFSETKYLYVAGRDKNNNTIVARTSDGVNWSLANTGLPGRILVFNDLKVVAFSGTTYLYAALWDGGTSPSGNRIYRTSDGVNWTEADNGIPKSLLDQAVLTTAAFSGINYLYIGFRDPVQNGGGIYRTSDGINWSAVNTGLSFSMGGFGAFSSAEFSGIQYLYVTGDSFTSSINRPNIYRTSDGVNWVLANIGFPTWYDLRSLSTANFSGTNYLYVAGLHNNAPSVYRTSNGINWEAVNAGMPPITNGNIEKGGLAFAAFSGADYLYLSGADYGGSTHFIYRTSDGVSWSPSENNIASVLSWSLESFNPRAKEILVFADFSGTDYLYVGLGNTGSVYRTSDGINWVDSFNTSYITEGVFTSSVIDAGSIVKFSTIRWTEDLPFGTDITMQTRMSNDGNKWSDWSSPVTDASGSKINGPAKRYIQYRANFLTGNSYTSPVLSDVTIKNNK